MLKIPKRFLYCVAFGGLNDVLNQTMRCHNYCKKHSRKLILNTINSRLRDNLDNYFIIKNIDSTVLPFIYNNAIQNMTLEGSNKTFVYDENINYKSTGLVSANCRINGTLSKDFFVNFPLRKEILEILKSRYHYLPKEYIAVHIRNTDYRSNIDQFITTYVNRFQGKNIFLSSDNSESIEEFKHRVDANIITFSNIPKLNDDQKFIGLHKIDSINKYELNRDSILDLLLLSLGTEIYCSCPKSGFSKNAKTMNDPIFKEFLLKQL